MSVPHISSDVLDTPITDVDIATIARDYLVRWEELAQHLGLTAAQEHSIRQTFWEYGNQKREALRRWKRNKGNGATYRTFITAAETISNMQLADNVRALLKLQHTSTGEVYTKPAVDRYVHLRSGLKVLSTYLPDSCICQ